MFRVGFMDILINRGITSLGMERTLGRSERLMKDFREELALELSL